MKRRVQACGLLVAALLLCLGLSAPVVWGAACGSISGTVVDSSAVPLESVTVNVYHANHILIGTTATDFDGAYSVISLPPGSYKVEFETSSVTSSTTGYLKQWYSNKYDFTSATSVTVAAGTDTPNINVSLNPGGSISGTVTGTTSLGGIEGVTVTIYDSATSAVLGYVTTGLDGSYIHTGLPAGNYKVRFSWDTEACSGTIWYSSKTDITTADPVSVIADAETRFINATLPTGTINGSVTFVGSPISNTVMVTVYDAATGNQVGETSTSNGHYTLTIPPGNYKIEFSPSDTTFVTKWHNNKYSETTADVVTLANTQTLTINASLERGGTISGTVKDSISNAGINGAIVQAYDSVTGDQLTYGMTSALGAYTVQGLRTGQSYKIQFTDSGYVDQWYNNKSIKDSADLVAVPNPTPVININASLVKSVVSSCANLGKITGKVFDPCGNAAIFTSVTAYDAAGQISGTPTNADMNGAYSLACLPSGSYKIVFSSLLLQGYIASANATVTAPNVTTLPDVTLGMGGSISGRVVNVAGMGVANAYISIIDAAGNSIGLGFGATTDANGYYVAGGLPTGSYKIMAIHIGCSGLETTWYNNQAFVAVTAPNGVTGINISFGGTPTNHLLTVLPVGTGTGSVTSDPAGINCPSGTCSASFPAGHVLLTAQSLAGSVFAGWSGGGCSGTGNCDVNLLADIVVTATFNITTPTTRTISVSTAGTGTGTVTSAPTGINCPSGTCSLLFPTTSSVTLTPSPTTGSVFAGWNSGGCSGTGNCTIPPGTSAISTTATFTTATVKRGGYYSLSINDAYASANGGDTIQVKAQNFAESLNLTRGITFLLKGGYNETFTTMIGTTVIQKPFIVRTGKVTIANIAIR